MICVEEENKTADAGMPRHAEVVPSFIVSWMKRPLSCWLGEVQPRELIRWARAGDLTNLAREELRDQILTRLRARMQELWTEPVRMALAVEWRSRLSSGEAKQFESTVLPLLSETRPFEALTLREVKVALRQPLDRVFSVLARIEAVDWVPPVLHEPAVALNQRVTESQFVEVDEGMRALASEVLAYPWSRQVDARDLRFEAPGSGLVRDWIAGQLTLPRAHGSFPALLQTMKEAQHMTAAQEARALAVAAAGRSQPRPGADGGARWADILVTRHLSAEGHGRTLEEVGVLFGVTRERVRQICAAMEDQLNSCHEATPSLDRVLMAAARNAPSGVDEINMQLSRFIGAGAGIEALVSWAEALGRSPLPVRLGIAQVQLQRRLVRVKMVETRDSAHWMVSALRYATRDCAVIGCSNLVRVAGMLALRNEVAPGQEAIQSTLAVASGFRWLDEDAGWFTLGNTAECAAAKRVRKVVAVAHDTVGPDDIAAALASDDMWIYREETRTLSIPPVHVLRELFRGWDFLLVVQKGRFTARAPLPLADVLSNAEALTVAIIEQHDGVACRFELKEAIVQALGTTDIAVSAMLGSSPIVLKVEHGLYALLGRRVGGAALDAARNRVRERSRSGPAQPSGLGPNDFALHVTDAVLRNEQYGIPTRFKQRLSGPRLVLVRGEDGEVLGQARINQLGVLAGLNRLLPSLTVESTVVVTVADDGIQVRVSSPALAGPVEARTE